MLNTTTNLKFRDHVRQEAQEQRRLRAANQPIPANLKKYARLSGLVLLIAPGIGEILFFLLLSDTGYVSVTFSLLFLVLMVIGLAQIISGRHIISGR